MDLGDILTLNKVVIIDSGLSEIFLEENKDKIEEYKDFCGENNIFDVAGHGTAVAGIILTINKNVKLSMYKIFDYRLVQEERILILSLEYLQKSDISDAIIHMSLGVNYYNKNIYELLKGIAIKGNIIVAAFDNDGCISYPAAFDFVIGVESSELCAKPSDFFVPDNAVIDVFSKGGIHRVVDRHNKFVLKTGNSLSAAYVSAYLSFISGSLNKKRALEYLKNISTYINVDKQEFNIISYGAFYELTRIKKAALFPYNKEIRNILRFSDQLTFDITDVYTSKYLGNLGRTVESDKKEYVVKSINNINYNNFDTLIIGHLNILEGISKKDIKEEVISDCLRNRKNIFMLDGKYLDKYYEVFKEQGNFIYSPTLSKKAAENNSKMYKIKSPVISIFGTSSKQGKYTLQIMLRNLFLESGYKVAQISTEPIGELFGMDATIPFGFESNNDLSSKEFILLVNSKLHELDVREPDLIFIGSQSYTIPVGYNNYNNLAIRQIEYLIAVNADAALLCVNAYDDIEYIKRTIGVIENMTQTKVLCLIIFPFEYNDNWKGLSEKIKRVSHERLISSVANMKQFLKLPVFILDNEMDILNIGGIIIDFFSGRDGDV